MPLARCHLKIAHGACAFLHSGAFGLVPALLLPHWPSQTDHQRPAPGPNYTHRRGFTRQPGHAAVLWGVIMLLGGCQGRLQLGGDDGRGLVHWLVGGLVHAQRLCHHLPGVLHSTVELI
eukprot:comp24041_c1_seq1/m.43076 comp24041_c1_seq1/g.43076  ORF comp24041_c1_seq1/g.43076 comp24041_c1_seq1/m.43076 type:complete len:119 (+) comp24041_c1_seq1:512-868(+)